MSQSITVGEAHVVSPLRKFLGFALTLGATLGTFGFFAVQGVLLARMLGPDQRGVFAAAVMFPQLLLYLGLLGAPELFAGYAAAGLPDVELRRSAARYGLVSGCLTTLACVLLNFLTIPAEMASKVMPLAILCALTMPVQQIRLAVQAVDHGQRNLTRYNQVRLVAAAIFPALLCLAFSLGYHSLNTACALFVLAQVLSLSLAQLGMEASWLGKSAVPVPRALREAKGLMGAWFATELLERLDLVLVMILVASESELGFYAAAVPAASLMIVVPNAAGIYVFNRGARREERLTVVDAWRYLTLGVVVQFACAAVLAVALPIMITTFYGEQFTPTIRFAWLLLPAGVFRGLLQACDSYLRARKNPGLGVRARAISIPILLAFSFGAGPWLGASAIPIGLSIAQCVCFMIVARGVIQDAQRPDV
ncbi:MAG: hypothetical protein R3C53_10260 [Pirellulaceae bacterium]